MHLLIIYNHISKFGMFFRYYYWVFWKSSSYQHHPAKRLATYCD